MRTMFSATRAGVAKVLDPAHVRWIGFSHFESDECGALNEWLAAAPHARAVCSVVGAMVSVDDFAARPARALADNEVLPIGRHRMRFLATPHVPHGWDAGVFFEETERVLLCSDLFFQPGDPPPLVTADIMDTVRAAIVEGQKGPLAKDMPYTPDTDATLQRLADLEPRVLAIMHGAAFAGDGGRALRELAHVVRETIGRS
jgi:flavorubredoxin